MLATLLLSAWKFLVASSPLLDVGGNDVDEEESTLVPLAFDVDPMSTYWESHDAMRPFFPTNIG